MFAVVLGGGHPRNLVQAASLIPAVSILSVAPAAPRARLIGC
jgi:hypothetical protein